jgi:hypothetical protein
MLRCSRRARMRGTEMPGRAIAGDAGAGAVVLRRPQAARVEAQVVRCTLCSKALHAVFKVARSLGK